MDYVIGRRSLSLALVIVYITKPCLNLILINETVMIKCNKIIMNIVAETLAIF